MAHDFEDLLRIIEKKDFKFMFFKKLLKYTNNNKLFQYIFKIWSIF